MINQLKKMLFSNYYAICVRNALLIRPNIYKLPQNSNSAISDFFFWENSEIMETQINVMNLSSQVLPNLKQKDFIKIFIFNDKGNLIIKDKFVLEDSSIKKINLNSYKLNGFGSLCIFHQFENINSLKDHNSFISERGYMGYRINGGIWNYIHGNHNALSFINDKIKPLSAYSVILNKYIPQINFTDVKSFEVIFSNPFDKSIYINVSYEIDNKKKIIMKKVSKKSTIKIPIISNFNIDKIEIRSNYIFCRPIIKKNYAKYFDMLHG